MNRRMWEIKLTDVVFYNESAAGGKVIATDDRTVSWTPHNDIDITHETCTMALDRLKLSRSHV